MPAWKRLLTMLALSGTERLVIRDESGREILASCWLENSAGFSNVRGWLFTAPDLDHGPYAEALLDHVVSRYDRSAIHFEHPLDDASMNDLFKHHHFKVSRELWHMRLDL